MGIQRQSDGSYDAWYYGGRKNFSSLSKARAYEDELKDARNSKKKSSSTSRSSTSSSSGSTSKRTSSSGSSSTTTKTPQEQLADITATAEKIQAGIDKLRAEEEAAKKTASGGGASSELTNLSIGLANQSGGGAKTTASGGGASSELRNLSIGLAQGGQITQQDIDAGKLQSGGEMDYVSQMGLEPNGASDELRNLSIGMARGDITSPEQQEVPMNNEQVSTEQAIQGVSAYGSAGLTPEQTANEEAAQQARFGGGAEGFGSLSNGPFLNVGGAFYQQSEFGLAPVTNSNIISGLKDGTIPSNIQSPFIEGGLNFAPGVVTADGQLIQTPEQQQTLQQTWNGMEQKYGVSYTPDQFISDPLSTINELTTNILEAMGYDSATSEYEEIANELEELENDRDKELRDIDDNPWLTEGVRLRQRQKAEEKWADQINNRVNKLQLLDSVRDDARQNAQFAIGTALSMWGTMANLQLQQAKLVYDQAQNSFDNKIKLAQLNEVQSGMTSAMKEWLFAVENGQTNKTFDQWVHGMGSTGGGYNLQEAEIDGNLVLYDPRTGDIVKTLGPVTQRPGDIGQNQYAAATYVSRMEEAEPVFSEGKGMFIPVEWMPDSMKSQERRQWEVARNTFITAVLRRESGAAISPTEYADADRIYIPLATDDEATLARKAAQRRVVIEGMKNEAAGAYTNLQNNLYPQPTQTLLPMSMMDGSSPVIYTGQTSSGIGYTIYPN